MDFISPTLGSLEEKELLHSIRTYVEEDPSARYKIAIGTDSQTNVEQTLFVTAVVVNRVGRGSRYYYHKWRSNPITDLRNRIYKETELSLTVVGRLKEVGMDDLTMSCPLEIHLDVGQKGETKVLTQEVTGWVSAVGYVAIIKPDSYGASTVADRLTK